VIPEHRRKVLPLLIHGDARLRRAGDCGGKRSNLSQLAGYSTGGTFHIVVNNQIGFTTLPEETRRFIDVCNRYRQDD